jgi:hypothetical protein
VDHAARWPVSSTMPPMGVLKTAPSAARAYVRTTLVMWGMSDLASVLDLVVSELVTNGINASTGPDGSPLYVDGRMLVVQLRLLTDGMHLMAEVWDKAPGVPIPKEAGPDEESRRGPRLVDSLTGSRWGWQYSDNGDGIVWPSGIDPVMSAKDVSAPGLRQAIEAGLLPDYSACLAAGQQESR